MLDELGQVDEANDGTQFEQRSKERRIEAGLEVHFKAIKRNQ